MLTPDRWRKIEELYQAAKNCAPGERAAQLDGADPDIRARVERMLEIKSSGGLLDQSPINALADSRQTVMARGTQLGPYRIEAQIGAGGMGKVYRALDTRLGRAVAVKISVEQFGQRFEREARAISALNHPNICTLYDVGPNYLVMELVEGTTLAARIAKGALPIAEVLRYGAQIAESLVAAHAKGIVHRDLKPGNIMLAEAGIKVLDFGLAKSQNDETLTAAEVVMGTPAYMAPEQRDGKPCDARADIYALGMVIYEMATGRRPQSVGQCDALPERLAHVVRRCLAQDPEERWQSARDLKMELYWAGEDTNVPTPAPRPGQNGQLWLIPSVVAIMALAALALVYFEKPAANTGAIFATIPAPGTTSFDLRATASLSPDGRRIVFSAAGEDGKNQLWVRTLDGTVVQPLQGTGGGTYPFWSPDGKSLGFFAAGKLKKIEISGGPPVDICDAALGGGGTWAADGTIVFAPNGASSLLRVPTGGGQSVEVMSLNRAHEEALQYFPQFLPDNRHFLYSSLSAFAEFSGIYLGSLDGGSPKLLLRGVSDAAFAPPGYILYVHAGTIMARRFDTKRYEASGDAEAIAHLPGAADAAASLSAQANGILVFLAAASAADQRLEWFNRAGQSEGVVGEPGIYFTPRLSSNDGKLAVTFAPPGSPIRHILIFDLMLHNDKLLTFDQFHNWTPVWNRDGSRLAYSSNPKKKFHIYVKPADGSGATRPLLEDDATEYVDSWSPDGKYVAYSRSDPDAKRGWDIWVLPLFGGLKPYPVVESQSNKDDPSFSPDEKWLAYDSDESGQWEVYVVAFPHGDGKWQVSKGGGQQPRWRGDGKELFFVGTGNRLMAAEVRDKGASLEIDHAQALPIHPVPSPFRTYDVTRDGKRFIVITGSGGPGARDIGIISNWPALLRARN
ncbi:MAG TPA: protein kinase [Bryobacteraceae bacterium]|nr:protein kinase [Bryobacteraceae bacterium]